MEEITKKRLFEILEVASADDVPSKVFDISIMVLISLNVLAVVLETVDWIYRDYERYFLIFEVFSVSVFTLEYLLRIWACTTDKRYRGFLIGRLIFIISPLAIVDLAAILPFYLMVTLDLRFLRILKFFRLIRIAKIGRYSRALKTFGNVIKQKKEELLINVVAVFVLLIIASSLMYYVEKDAQPGSFSSIPEAMWWGVATLTTVGYGDVYPITPLGKLFSAIIAILGIGLFALPTAILASGFSEEIRKRKKKERICPHCGKDTEKPPKKGKKSGKEEEPKERLRFKTMDLD